MKSSSACNYLWEIENLSENDSCAEDEILQNIDTTDAGECAQSRCQGGAHDSIYVRYETDYVVDDISDNAQSRNSYRFIRDFEINNFKVKHRI